MYKSVLLIVKNNYSIKLLQIFDANGVKVVERFIRNRFVFKGNVDCTYKVVIISNDIKFITSIFIDREYDNFYVFYIQSFHKIFIKLVDQNYDGLRIEKGRIKIWITHTI